MTQSIPATTTTPLVTVVCCSTSSPTMTVTMDPTFMGLQVTLYQHDVVLPPLLMSRDTGGIVGLAIVLQQQCPSWMSPQAYANYAMGPLQVSFSFRVEPPTDLLIYVAVCSGVHFPFSAAMLDAIFTNWGSNIGVCTTADLWSIPVADICASWWWALSLPGMH